ncbi:MAG TPA: HAD-IA family hydrolase [Candidatus Krumholzibacteria bacterium]|nr:HAD-IA family hydrolase [Candidatus Krumholzibacteria bacterium]HPD70921.1 HAD-IA family hydrolase [Candidatus Krumholzibacteria bacterium]HRY39379.1 HAD-IA family hydrolase [Candidatus Krumholzibacteria bacterium]
MQQRPIRAVIFDLDNTLTDFLKAKDDAIRAAIDAMIDAGLPLDAATAHQRLYEIYRREGIEYQKVFNRFLQTFAGEVDDRILAAAVVAYRRARDGSLVLYPHAKMVLNRLLRDGYGLAVVSDAPRFEAWLRLCSLGLQHTFDRVFTYDDTGVRKPDPLPFNLALRDLGVSPREAVMIGDWPTRDIRGAKDLGLHTVWARYGDKAVPYKDRSGAAAEELAAAEAEFVIDDLAQLLEVLDRLNAAGRES